MHSSTGQAENELGPFQEIWNAWNDVDQEIKKKPIEHFRRAVDIQFDELEEHLRNNDRTRARREAMDVISIALNLLRQLDCKPDDVEKIARDRAANRMHGQAKSILDKYETIYGI